MKKTPIGILAGEDVDMPGEYLEKNKVQLYQFSLSCGDVSIPRGELYEYMKKCRGDEQLCLPKTSQPSVGYLKEKMEKSLEMFNEIIVLCISSKVSGCYNAALQARELLDKDQRSHIHIIESPVASGASALIVYQLVDLIEKQLSLAQILKEIEEYKKTVCLVFMIEDSFWLEKGGRINAAVALILNQMKKIGVRPLLGAKEGKIALLKVRLNAKNKVEGMLSFLEQELGTQKAVMTINHSDNLKEASELKKKLLQNKNITLLHMHTISPVLGAHIGPGGLLVAWKII